MKAKRIAIEEQVTAESNKVIVNATVYNGNLQSVSVHVSTNMGVWREGKVDICNGDLPDLIACLESIWEYLETHT